MINKQLGLLLMLLLLSSCAGHLSVDPRGCLADAKWGSDPDYQAYRRNTSVLVPRPPRR